MCKLPLNTHTVYYNHCNPIRCRVTFSHALELHLSSHSISINIIRILHECQGQIYPSIPDTHDRFFFLIALKRRSLIFILFTFIQNMKALGLVVLEIFYVFPMTPPGRGLYGPQGQDWQDL